MPAERAVDVLSARRRRRGRGRGCPGRKASPHFAPSSWGMPDAPHALLPNLSGSAPGSAADADRDPARLALAAQLIGDDGLLDTLADRLADRLAARLSPVAPAEALIDAREVARRTGKTRRWVYEHARELGAVPLGTGPRPRLGFSPDVIAQLKAAPKTPVAVPLRTGVRRRGRSSGSGRTIDELLNGPRVVVGARADGRGRA